MYPAYMYQPLILLHPKLTCTRAQPDTGRYRIQGRKGTEEKKECRFQKALKRGKNRSRYQGQESELRRRSALRVYELLAQANRVHVAPLCSARRKLCSALRSCSSFLSSAFSISHLSPSWSSCAILEAQL